MRSVGLSRFVRWDTAQLVPDSLDAPREVFESICKAPGPIQATDANLQVRRAVLTALRESDSARELKARHAGGGQCWWSLRVVP